MERLSPTQDSFRRDQKLVLEAAGVMMKGVKLVQDSYDLFNPSELSTKIVDVMLKKIKMVPHTTVHARYSYVIDTNIVNHILDGELWAREPASLMRARPELVVDYRQAGENFEAY